MKKKVLSLLLSVSVLLLSFAACSSDAKDSEPEVDENGIVENDADEVKQDAAAENVETNEEGESEEETDAVGIWPKIAGDGTSYDNLFSVILSDDCYDIWFEKCAQAVGEENAADTVQTLQSFISSDIYGPEAEAAYAEEDYFLFDCWYINGAENFTFNYNDGVMTAEIKTTDGNVEEHTYEYMGVYQIGADELMTWDGQEFCPAFDCDVYKSVDDAGEFTYLFFRDDTMEATYHIEFRYGSDLVQLQQYLKGEYAYWLAAGFDVDADEETLENVIGLFCEENAG